MAATGLPISVLTGFLGSGKTTFLRRVLSDPGLRDTAVVVNEFGAIGLDHLLVEASPDEVVQIGNGCLCCAVRQDLVRTLYGLLNRRAAGEAPFRRVVVETSGLAEPAPILYTLAADAQLERALRFDTVLAVVDAVAGETTLDRFAEASAQVAVADRLFLSKTDLAPASTTLLDRLAALNPTAELAGPGDRARPARLLFREETEPSAPPRWRTPFSTVAHSHGLATLSVRLRQPMTRLAFARALGGLARERGEDLLRVKGILAFADRPDKPAAIHAVQHTLYPPDWLAGWPDEDRESRLVFITRSIPEPDILARFAEGCPVVLG